MVAECIIIFLPQTLSIRCLAEIKLLMVAECIIFFLLPQALSIRCLAEIQADLVVAESIIDLSSLPSIVNSVPLVKIQLLLVAESVIIILQLPTIYNSVFYSNGSDIANNNSSLAQQGSTIFLRTIRKQVSLPWMQTPFIDSE